jgi:hypothetical protein
MQSIMPEQQNEIRQILHAHTIENYSDTLTRYSYIADGTQNFLDMIQNPNYQGYRRELLILERMAAYFPRGRHIIDLGPGNGIKGMMIAQSSEASSYLAIDMSQSMLETARSNFNLNIPAEFKCMDFLNFTTFNNSMILLLGNTLTNEIDMNRMLTNIRNSCRNSSLLIGIELFSEDINQILAEYRCAANYELTARPLEFVGMLREIGHIDIEYNLRENRIEEWFVVDTNFTSEDISLRPQDRILLSITNKPSIKQITTIIESSGWRIERIELIENQAVFLLSS